MTAVEVVAADLRSELAVAEPDPIATLEPEGDALIGKIELSSAPTRHGEFTDIFVAGLCLHTLSLRPLTSAPAAGAGSADDFAGGAAPQYVLVTAFPEGQTDIKPVSASGVVEFTERPVAVH